MEKVEMTETIAQLIEDYRTCAFNAIDEIIMEAFEEIARVMNEEKEGNTFLSVKGKLGGMTVAQILEIKSHVDIGDIDVWMQGDARKPVELAFLDLNALNNSVFRMKYPNAFQKWSEEDDKALVRLYNEGMTWADLSLKFGRNMNALKIRLQSLGYEIPNARRRY